jgi:hypothetical protein
MLFWALTTVLALGAWAQTNVVFHRTEDGSYGRKFGPSRTLDGFQPANTNGV